MTVELVVAIAAACAAAVALALCGWLWLKVRRLRDGQRVLLGGGRAAIALSPEELEAVERAMAR